MVASALSAPQHSARGLQRLRRLPLMARHCASLQDDQARARHRGPRRGRQPRLPERSRTTRQPDSRETTSLNVGGRLRQGLKTPRKPIERWRPSVRRTDVVARHHRGRGRRHHWPVASGRLSVANVEHEILLLVDQGTRHRDRCVAQEGDHQLRYVRRADQPPPWHPRLRFGESTFALAELACLHLPLAGRVGPIEIDAVHPDGSNRCE